MRASSKILVVVVVGALAAFALGSASAASHRRSNTIAVLRWDGAIWSVRPSGKALHRLTPDGVSSGSFAFAPDGKQIVYARYPCNECGTISLGTDLWSMNADGGHQRQLTRTSDVSEDEPTWSPDGRQIAYERYISGEGGEIDYGIWVMNADGTGQHRVTRVGHSPSWSPNGKRIAYVAHDRIFVLSVASGRSKNLTKTAEGGVYAQYPDWSPDGRKIVFSLNDDLTVMNANGGHRHPLTRSASFYEKEAAWSPDGRWIAFIREGDKSELELIRPSGKGRHLVFKGNGAGWDSSPAWQPS